MATLKNWRLLRKRVYFRSIGQMRVVANLRHCRARHRPRALRRPCWGCPFRRHFVTRSGRFLT